jgi:hypothetical protein
MFREAMKGQAGRKCGDNITQLTKAEKGTSKAYTLTRLQKDNPEAAQLTQSVLCEPRRTPR